MDSVSPDEVEEVVPDGGEMLLAIEGGVDVEDLGEERLVDERLREGGRGTGRAVNREVFEERRLEHMF